MAKPIIVPNALVHILLHGYLEHGYEVVLGNTEMILQNHSHSEILSIKQNIQSARTRLRGNTYLTPNLVSGIGSMLNIKEAVYPLEINFAHNEQLWFDLIINFSFADMKKYYKRYLKTQNLKLPPKNKFFYELLSALRTDKAVEYLRKKFVYEYYGRKK